MIEFDRSRVHHRECNHEDVLGPIDVVGTWQEDVIGILASWSGQHSHEQSLGLIEPDLLVCRANDISRVIRATVLEAVEVNFVSFALIAKKDEDIALGYRT